MTAPDAESLAAAIRGMAADPARLAAAKAAALAVSESAYSWERVSRNLVEIYQAVMDRPAPGAAR
jgi:glycosyltransferase involved in cell wall biosynthesis